MIRALPYACLREFRDQYPSAWAAAGELFALALSLAVYSYTARAFAPAFAEHLGAFGNDYFAYMLIGETALFVPFALFHGLASVVRQGAADGSLEAFLSLPSRQQSPLLLLAAAKLPKELARAAAYVLLATIGFGLRLPLSALPAMLALQLLAIPAFCGLGMLCAGGIVAFGRGYSLLAHLGTLAAFAAGAYFPTSVLPPGLASIASALSPFNALLEATRAVVADGTGSSSFLACSVRLLIWGVLLVPTGYLALGMSFTLARRKGSPILFTS